MSACSPVIKLHLCSNTTQTNIVIDMDSLGRDDRKAHSKYLLKHFDLFCKRRYGCPDDGNMKTFPFTAELSESIEIKYGSRARARTASLMNWK